MTSNIVLISCISFSMLLIMVDSKNSVKSSATLWIPLIWMMIVASRMVSLWFYPTYIVDSPEVYLEGSSFDRNIFIILIISGIIILHQRNIKWSQVFRKNFFLFCFFYYCGISILWSDFSDVAFKRWIKAIGNLIMVLIVITEKQPVEAVKTMFKRTAFILIPMSIVLIKYFPLFGRKYHRFSGELTITGVTTNKNALGCLCLICGIYFVWQILSSMQNKPVIKNTIMLYIQILMLSMILWLIIKTNSATSLICFIMGIIFLLWLGTPMVKNNLKLVGFYIGFSIITMFAIQALFDIAQIVLHNLGRDSTFTGRTDVWQDCIALGGNPIIGTGYDSFWLGQRMELLWDKYWWNPTESHNGYLEIYLELGIIGLAFLIIIIIMAYKKISKNLITNFEYGSFQLAILLIVLVYNTMEAAFKGLHLIWFVFLLIIFEYFQRSNNHVY